MSNGNFDGESAQIPVCIGMKRGCKVGLIKKKGYSMESMLNVGKEMKAKLFSIGVRAPEDLIRLCSKEVFRQFKKQYPNVCLVHLYALQGAVDYIDYIKLSDEVKLDLKKIGDSLKEI